MKHGPKRHLEWKNVWPLAVPGALLLSVQFAAASAAQGQVVPLGTGGSLASSGGGSASGGSVQLDSGSEEGTEELGSGGIGSGGMGSGGGSGGVVRVR